MLAAGAGGCAKPAAADAAASSPAFPHERHLVYFTSGQHRSEKIAMHKAIFGGGDVPEEVTGGRCAECHTDLATRTACATCHVAFQNASLRSRTDLRPCVACHRGTWMKAPSAAPRPDTCPACHDPERQPANSGVRLERVKFAPPPEAPILTTTLPKNVYFSHKAHVRFGNIACTKCHQAPGAPIDRASSRPFMTMSQCLRCHRDNGASTDCLTCHK